MSVCAAILLSLNLIYDLSYFFMFLFKKWPRIDSGNNNCAESFGFMYLGKVFKIVYISR